MRTVPDHIPRPDYASHPEGMVVTVGCITVSIV